VEAVPAPLRLAACVRKAVEKYAANYMLPCWHVTLGINR